MDINFDMCARLSNTSPCGKTSGLMQYYIAMFIYWFIRSLVHWIGGILHL